MKKMSYESAMEELQAIVQALQENAIGMDELPEKLRRAAELIHYCRERLRNAESQIQGLFQDAE